MPFMPDPLMGGGGALPGLMGPGGVGGMHVGPSHPFFSDRLRHPEMQPGMHPPGARWDPISEASCVPGSVAPCPSMQRTSVSRET